MASPTPKTKARRPPPPPELEVVSPAWLIKALGATLAVALLCSYITFCFLYYQGQWQLVLHPVRTKDNPQTIAGNPYELVHFGPDESATPQLIGWWIPAPANGRYAGLTLLFLPGADGSLTNAVPALGTLHQLGINVFAFDYRGYGQSAPAPPSQRNMAHDAESAWEYLTSSRHIPASRIIPYGTGVGGPLATQLAAAHGAIPALILDSPSGDLLDVALHDPRSHLIPVRLLFHERFPLAAPLGTLRTPKLLISYPTTTGDLPAAFRTASDPKVTVELAPHSEGLYTQAVLRFLDQYIPAAQLVPTPAPSTQSPH